MWPKIKTCDIRSYYMTSCLISSNDFLQRSIFQNNICKVNYEQMILSLVTYILKSVAFSLNCCTEMRWMFISSTAIWVTSSDTSSVASRARSHFNSSKYEWTRIWTTYLECRWNNPERGHQNKKNH